MVARYVRIVEVRGSNPLCSTIVIPGNIEFPGVLLCRHEDVDSGESSNDLGASFDAAPSVLYIPCWHERLHDDGRIGTA